MGERRIDHLTSFSGLHHGDLKPEGQRRRPSDGRLTSGDQGEDVSAGVEHHLQDEPGQGALPEPHHQSLPHHPRKRGGEPLRPSRAQN